MVDLKDVLDVALLCQLAKDMLKMWLGQCLWWSMFVGFHKKLYPS
jgi:hypothetical protein